MAGATWNCCSLGASSVYTIELYKHTCGTVPLGEVHGCCLACDKCWSCWKTVYCSAHSRAFSLSIPGLDGCFEWRRETAYSGEFFMIRFVVCLVMGGIFILCVFVVDLCLKFVLRWCSCWAIKIQELPKRKKKGKQKQKWESSVCGKNDSFTVILA